MSFQRSNQPAVLSVFNLVPNKLGGLEAYAKELSRQLDSHNWRSILCFLSPPPESVKEYFDLPNVTLENLNGSAKGLAFYSQLRRMILRHRPEILHLHLVAHFGFYSWLAHRLGVKKIFYTDHFSRPEGYLFSQRPLLKRWLFRLAMAHLNRVFCVSQYVSEAFDMLGFLPKSRTSTIYNGIDLERAAAGRKNATAFRNKLGISNEDFLVVQVGQIIPEKGVADLIDAALQVCSANNSVHFVFIGEGLHLEQYRALATSLGLTRRVDFAGPAIDPLASGVFSAADLVCQVSRWEEAFGLTIAEAMASGRPVLATRCGGIPELVADGISGYLVARGDSKTMAVRILELADNRSLANTFGNAGEKICRERFDLSKNTTQLLSYYEIP